MDPNMRIHKPMAGISGFLELLYGDGKNFDHEEHMYIQQIFGSVNMLCQYCRSLRHGPPNMV